MIAVSWHWFGHAFIFVGILVGLLVPAAVLLVRWREFGAWVLGGLVAGAVGAAWLLNKLVSSSTVISIASWTLRHRLLVLSTALVVVGLATAIYSVASVHDPTGAKKVGRVFCAVVAAAAGGALIAVAFLLATTWTRRYSEPVGVNTSVPRIEMRVGRYVALGDSYSAGEGLPPFVTGTQDPPAGDNCHRSALAYSQLLSIKTAPDDFRACSGAVMSEIFEFSQNPRQGVQVRPHLLGPNVGLVTLTIGGNDMHFSDVLAFCGRNPDCISNTLKFNPGPPNSHEPGLAPAQPIHAWADKMLVVLRGRLDRLFADLRTAAPNARIIVIGYPRLLPNGNVPRQFNSCDDILAAFSKPERAFLADREQALNRTIFDATKATHIEFIDPTHDFSSHEACGAGGALINDTKIRFIDRFPFIALDRGAFHPTAGGQRVFAREVACYLNEYQTPPSTADETTAPGSDADPIRC